MRLLHLAVASLLALTSASSSFATPASTTPTKLSAADSETEKNFLVLIDHLDSSAKEESNISEAINIAVQAQTTRRSLAGFYHKQRQYQKILPLYQDLIERDKQLVSMAGMTANALGLDYKYLADMHAFLGNADQAESLYKKALNETQGNDNVLTRKSYASFLRKHNRTAEAAQAEADAGGTASADVTTRLPAGTAGGARTQPAAQNPNSEFVAVDKMVQKAQQLVKVNDTEAAKSELRRAITLLSEQIEPEVKRKMLTNVPGFNLDRWHGCLTKQAELYKKLAEVSYKQGHMNEVQSAYETLVVLKDSGGISLEDREGDYAYLVTVCEANHDQKKCELYHICLLKAKSSHLGQDNPEVLATMDKFATYMRTIGETTKAGQLEARAKANRTNVKDRPRLWFSY